MFEYNKSKIENFKNNINWYKKKFHIKIDDIYVQNQLALQLYKGILFKIFAYVLLFIIIIAFGLYISKYNNYIINLYSRFLNSNKESSINFIGTIIGGIFGFIGAILIFSLQELKASLIRKKNAKNELSLLIIQVLYAYNKLIGMSEQKSSDNSTNSYKVIFQDNLVRGKFIFLKDWDKYLVHLDNIEDVQSISMFLTHLQSLDESDQDLSRDNYYTTGKLLVHPLNIDVILRKYDKLYLDNNFITHYREECAFQ